MITGPLMATTTTPSGLESRRTLAHSQTRFLLLLSVPRAASNIEYGSLLLIGRRRRAVESTGCRWESATPAVLIWSVSRAQLAHFPGGVGNGVCLPERAGMALPQAQACVQMGRGGLLVPDSQHHETGTTQRSIKLVHRWWLSAGKAWHPCPTSRGVVSPRDPNLGPLPISHL